MTVLLMIIYQIAPKRYSPKSWIACYINVWEKLAFFSLVVSVFS